MRPWFIRWTGCVGARQGPISLTLEHPAWTTGGWRHWSLRWGAQGVKVGCPRVKVGCPFAFPELEGLWES